MGRARRPGSGDQRGRVVRSRDRSTLLRGGLVPPFPHGSIMFRRGAFEAAGGYRQACTYWEDRDLFIRLGQQGRLLRGSLRLWAGLRPGILRPLLSRGGVRVSAASLRVLALAALGEVSPRLYRWLHQEVHRPRDRRGARGPG